MVEPPSSDEPEELAERILDRFRGRLGGGPVVRAELRAELVAEARPAVHALLFATSLGRAADPSAFEHHESMAMLTLLGRRAGALRLTTSSALAVAPAIAASSRDEGAAVPQPLEELMTSAFMEGFVLGREDELLEAAARRAATSIATLTVGPRVLALVVSGEQDAAAVTEAVEAFGRALFQADARAAIVDVSHLRAGGTSLARAVFAADEAARTLGVLCTFSGASEALLRDAEEAGLELRYLDRASRFDQALARCLGAAGRSGPTERALLPSLRRLFVRR